jgi:hypothetical protein
MEARSARDAETPAETRLDNRITIDADAIADFNQTAIGPLIQENPVIHENVFSELQPG